MPENTPAVIDIAATITELAGPGFSGAVLVRRRGEPPVAHAFGHADRANERANRTDTSFGTASAGKAFVAVAVMSLVEDGRLDLNARLGDLLPDLLAGEPRTISPEITVHQLLNHTSGIGDYFDESVMDDYAELFADYPTYRIRTSADMIPLFADRPMASAPGEQFSYNNTGYVVLGLIIEAVSGQPFDALVAETVFAPAGMTGTGYFELDRLPGNCATGYVHDEDTDEWHSNVFSIPAKGTGDGGVLTTVEDVERFWSALRAGRLLSAETAAQLFAVQATGVDEDGDEEAYGFGFWLGGDDASVPAFMGEDPGVAFMTSDDGDLCIVVVSNTGDDVWEIHSGLRDALAG